MTRHPERPSHISEEDWQSVDVPEATDEEWSRAVRFADAHPEIYSAWQRGRVSPPKVQASFRIASELFNRIKATGRGYNARVEKALTEALARGELNGEGKPDR